MDRILALVMLDRPVEPDLARVVEAIGRRHPGTSASLPETGAAELPMLLCNGEIVVVMSMPAPIPRDEGVIKRALLTWPQAKEVFDRHQGHLIVSTLAKGEHQLPIARILTAAVGALVETVPGCRGVVWGGVAHPAQRWLDMSRAAFAPCPNFPFALWIGMHPFQYDSGIGAVTLGLSQFVGREIEFEGKGLDVTIVLDRVMGLAAYLIERGALVADGDTFGVNDTERMTVKHATSRRLAGMPVLLATA